MGPLTITKFFNCINPWRINWFYRPFAKILMLSWNSIGLLFGQHASEVASHVFSAVVFGSVCFYIQKLIEALAPRYVGLSYLTPLIVLIFTPGMEAVTWACSVGAPLATLFSLMAILATLHSKRWWAKWVYVFMAMCSKEDAMLLPAIIFIIEYTYRYPHLGRSGISAAVTFTIWGALENIAYAHSTFFHFAVANTGRGTIGTALDVFMELTLGSFLIDWMALLKSEFIAVPGVMYAPTNILLLICSNWALIWIPVAITLYAVCKSKNVLLWSILLPIFCLASPVLAGVHAIASRFYFYPYVYVAIFWSIFMAAMVDRFTYYHSR
jgi:hypothetical protein